MKPTYALLSSGAYVALHLCNRFEVEQKEDGTQYDVIAEPAGEDYTQLLYRWSAYPHSLDEAGMTIANEVAADELLSRLVKRLAEDAGGIIEMDEMASEVAQFLGLEAAR